MLWFDVEKMIICLLVLVFVIPSVLRVLRLIAYYLGRNNPRFHKHLFRLNKLISSRSATKGQSKRDGFYFVMFFLVSLAGFYLLYVVLEKIYLKQVTIGQSWLMILLVLIIINVSLQELRPDRNKKLR